MTSWNKDILVIGNANEYENTFAALARIGLSYRIKGYLEGGFDSWWKANLPVNTTR